MSLSSEALNFVTDGTCRYGMMRCTGSLVDGMIVTSFNRWNGPPPLGFEAFKTMSM